MLSGVSGQQIAESKVLSGDKNKPLEGGNRKPGIEPHMSPWVQHDRTHLELLTHLPIPERGARRNYHWEVYFLLPRSLRINAVTFSDAAFCRSLQSHVRLVPPSLSVAELTRRLAQTVGVVVARPKACVRELKLFGCMAKVSLLAEQRRLLRLLRRNSPASSRMGDSVRHPPVEQWMSQALSELLDLAKAYRELLPTIEGERATVAAKWVDAYLSRLLEDVLVKLSIKLRKRGHGKVAQMVAQAAVAEAQYAVEHGLTQQLPGSEQRDLEALEAIAHYLKRFTSSVLWLRQDAVPIGNWQLQVLYSVAASIAMAFAVGIAFYNGGPSAANLDDLWMWILIVVLGYAGKDRIKASLQSTFSQWIAARLPDRQWRLVVPGGSCMGMLQERNAFVSRSKLPQEAMLPPETLLLGELRSAANLGNVLWYSKSFALHNDDAASADSSFQEVVEIVRLDLSRWLAHADNSPRKIYFADIEEQEVRAASAPRTYTIEIIHRLSSEGSCPSEWKTTHVVVDREGIRRVETAHRKPAGGRATLGRAFFESRWGDS